jgi:hypothetical protein
MPTALEDLDFGVGGGWLAVPVARTKGSIWMVERPEPAGRDRERR